MTSTLLKEKILFPYKAFYKVPYALPFWGQEEHRLFWDYFSNNNKSDAIEKNFISRIKTKLRPEDKVYFFDSARNSLKILLENLALPAGSQVLIPLLSCGVLPKVIEECKLKVLFADIGEDLCLTVETIKRAISPKTRAVMLIHAGGSAAKEYPQIVEFCRLKGLFLIDNAAAAWGNEADGIWLGGKGNAGLISFGVGKSTFGIGGGMLICSQPLTNERTERKRYGNNELAWFYLKYLLRSRSAPFFLYIDKLFKPRSQKNEAKQISFLDQSLQYSIFQRMEWLIKKRAEISLKIVDIMDGSQAVFPQINNKHVWTKLMVRLPEKLKIELQRYLYFRKIETEEYHYPYYLGGDYKNNIRFLKSQYPFADKIYREILVLPNSPGLNNRQLDYLYSEIKQFKRKYL